jgi:hypothetical protein
MDTEASAARMALKDWKETRGFAWSWLAMKSGVSYPRLLNWSRGCSPLNRDDFDRIAAILGITPDQITDAAPPESTEAPAIVPQEPQASTEMASEGRHGERRHAHDVA